MAPVLQMPSDMCHNLFHRVGNKNRLPYPNDLAGGLVQQGLSVSEALLIEIGVTAGHIFAIQNSAHGGAWLWTN
jgi:hypothetical protein